MASFDKYVQTFDLFGPRLEGAEEREIEEELRQFYHNVECLENYSAIYKLLTNKSIDVSKATARVLSNVAECN